MTSCPATLELQRDGRRSGQAACTLEGPHFPHKAHFAQTSGDWRTVTFKPGDTYETRSEDETMGEPDQKPGKSRQDYETPQVFIDAVEARFGALTHDLAANATNTKVKGAWYGPGSPFAEDALAQDWTMLRGNLWLNCEFRDIDPWAAKSGASLAVVLRDLRRRDRHDWRLFLLTPASIGTEWFGDHVHRKALVLGLCPRITFVGETAAYPKDLSLSVFGERPGMDVWRWTDRR